ncbi:MAG: hypothetical protein IKA65_08320, partial [Lentisphaeria bacterium]|nr:hypothetical protein [Lentisphaeria bacterium]
WGCCKTVLWGRNLFEKRFSSPRPIFQKLSPELLLLQVIKVIPIYLLLLYKTKIADFFDSK